MLFTSYGFLLFFVVVFFLYWLLLREKKWWKNWVILVASYVFYGIADWKMISLLAVATAIFYWLGIRIRSAKTEKGSNAYKIIGIVLGVGTLVYFKYFNFFVQSFSDLFSAMGLQVNLHTFNIIIPLGVSYFTFKLISYVIDIYNEELEPCRDFVVFADYVAFFPTIMAGPIDRPKAFISQLQVNRKFDRGMAVDGCRQILWGLFKKIVVADNCTIAIDEVFAMSQVPASLYLVAALLAIFQLYADFSGYSDMAIGLGKLLGVNVTRNFKYPFFATNIAEFWRRWHISLTKWMTDYVFTPLSFGMRRWGKFGLIVAIIVNMLLVGLWHGDNWTYAVFGLFHGLLFIPLIITGGINARQNEKTIKFGLPHPVSFLKMLCIFALCTCGIIIFNAESVSAAAGYFKSMADIDIWRASYRFFLFPKNYVGFLVLFMLVVEWIQRDKEHALDLRRIKYRWGRWLIYYMVILAIIFFDAMSADQFIYLKF